MAETAQRYHSILAAYDGSPGSGRALARAAELAAESGASLTVVQATTGEHTAQTAAEARHSLQGAIEHLDPKLEASPWIVGSPPAKAILAVADEIAADLIVTGSRGLGRIQTAVLGSVSSELVREAHCDVLVVRDGRR